MRFVLTLMLFASASASAVQAGTFTMPKGCTAFLSVQQHGCIAAHYWTCEGNNPGEHWSGELNQDGLIYVGQIDNEAQWLKSYFIPRNEEKTLITPAADPASLSTLLDTGLDTYDFTLNTPNGLERAVGYDRIAERNVMIGDEVLHRTEYSIRITDAAGEAVFEATGSEFVSSTHLRFFSGVGEVTAPGVTQTYNDSPVRFIYPGEKGFLSDEPIYDCAALSARHVIQ